MFHRSRMIIDCRNMQFKNATGIIQLYIEFGIDVAYVQNFFIIIVEKNVFFYVLFNIILSER